MIRGINDYHVIVIRRIAGAIAAARWIPDRTVEGVMGYWGGIYPVLDQNLERLTAVRSLPH
jgi:hypothetical protein